MLRRKRFGIKKDTRPSMEKKLNGPIRKEKKDSLDWGLKKADTQFSLYIRSRDGKCVRCTRTKPDVQLQCSHFWGRSRKNVRFDPENCDALCATCHVWGDRKNGIIAWEEEKQGEYRLFKIKQLGQEKYDAMEARAKPLCKDKTAVARCQMFLASQEYEGKPRYLTLLATQPMTLNVNGDKATQTPIE